MAKKIKVDFSKTEERSGWNTKRIPEGLYEATVASVQETEAQDGTAMLVYGITLADRRYKSRRFPFYCKLQPNQMWKLRDLFVSAGETVPKGKGQIDAEKPVGKTIVVEIEDDDFNGSERSSVNAVYGSDILDDDDAVAGDEDEVDEEEYEDEADEAEDEDDFEDEGDEEFEDDDEDEDLDDEEDDEDDEELYEDDEDEEEEAPAPKKRAAAKTPAKKPAAKAAAPAKRTVKRR